MAGLVGIWWVWLAFAIALGVVEVLLPGFIFLGFALGALVMAGIVGLVVPTIGVAPAMALFAGLSLLAWIVLWHSAAKARAHGGFCTTSTTARWSGACSSEIWQALVYPPHLKAEIKKCFSSTLTENCLAFLP